ncbi:MAG: glycosyltransferase family 4 protein [Bacilli bacterium]|nr:glycosyltransferase family 4 protein [Bacilli bacterium]
MKKKMEIIVYHLGYGGIEKAVSSLVRLLKDQYEISIVSFYQLYDKPVFDIPLSVSITYLYHTDVPLKVKKYNQLLHDKKYSACLKAVFQDYVKGFHLLRFFHDLWFSISIYFLNGRFRRLKKYLKSNQSDVYLSTRYEISKILHQFGGQSSLKIGWEHNHHHGNQVYRNQVIEASQELDYLVLVSRALTQDYQNDFQNKKCKAVYIPNMLDENLSFISDYSEKRILFVGRLEKEKGVFDALEVAKRLQERMISFHLDIVGDGPLRKEVEQNIYERNLSSYVTLHGFQNRDFIQNLYRHASLYLMTSFTESFGLVLLEAMNAGIPCLAFSSAEGACELISNDVNGYLIEERNMEEMVNHIDLLLKRPAKIQELGKNAREFSQNFLPESVRVMWTLLIGE